MYLYFISSHMCRGFMFSYLYTVIQNSLASHGQMNEHARRMSFIISHVQRAVSQCAVSWKPDQLTILTEI